MIQVANKSSTISPAPFQIEDMDHLEDRVWSCNWSEMGCYKTSTVLWLIPKWAEKIGTTKPKVLIITTRSGKGTYFKHVPDLLPNFNLFNLLTTQCKLIMEGVELPIDYNPHLDAASVFVAHYNVFSKRKKRDKKKADTQRLQRLEAEAASLDHVMQTQPENIPEEQVQERIDLGLKIEKLKKQLDPEPEQEEEDTGEINIEQMMLAEILGELTAAPKKEPRKPLLDDLLRTKWDIIILDEAHRIKEPNTGWTKEIKRLKGKVKHVMTGTGFINDPSEIWSLLNFCSKREYGSYWRFREYYCAEDLINGYRKIIGINPEHKEQFQKLVREIGPRRTKREVFKNLPEPIYTPYTVELNAIQRKMYESIRDELYALDQAGEGLFAPNVLAALQRLRQICVATPQVVADYYDPTTDKRVQKIELVEPSSKLDAVMDILDGLEWDEERKDQVVIFSNFKGPLQLLKKRFEPRYNMDGEMTWKGISYLELRQQDNDQKRYEKWAITFPRKEHQVFMSTLQLGSESISLTSASTCIFLDRAWSPKDNQQAESRVWRPGQEEVANIIHINAAFTVDDRVWATNEIKVGWFKEIFG